MSEKILVVGGVALGPKAACRCKRLMPDAEVMLVDENVFISYGGCGIPYYVSGEIQNLDDLRSTPYHTVRDPDFFRDMKGITVRTQTRYAQEFSRCQSNESRGRHGRRGHCSPPESLRQYSYF